MRGIKPTNIPSSVLRLVTGAAGALAVSGLFAVPAGAQSQGIILEEIVVTAQKREESLQDVPISVATMQGESLNALFSGSEDILALSGRVPGLYAESSNGRSAPRFYLRGLGNIDFDLAASQPVSVVMDEVVMENVVLKGFPLFDVQKSFAAHRAHCSGATPQPVSSRSTRAARPMNCPATSRVPTADMRRRITRVPLAAA